MAAPPDALLLATELRPVLVRLGRRLRQEAHQGGLTAGRIALLETIKGQPGIGVTELAQREAVSTPRISRAVGQLVALNVVERRPAADHRRVGLFVTPAGASVLRRVRRRRTAWLAERLECLDEADLEAIAAAVQPLTRVFEAQS